MHPIKTKQLSGICILTAWAGKEKAVWTTCLWSWTCNFDTTRMSSTGRMGSVATTFYKRLSSVISEKRNVEYAVTIYWICCILSFALLRAYIMSIKGARSSRHYPTVQTIQGPIDLQLAEGQIHWTFAIWLINTSLTFAILILVIAY